MFPHGAGYRHDDLHLRSELSDEERRAEPPNGDAHLTFIGSGLQNCVTYRHLPGAPVFFMDLDGVYNGHYRSRTSSVVGYNRERQIAEFRWEVPVSRHAIDSVNLNDERLGLRQRIEQLIARRPVELGRLDIGLDSAEQAAAVTVNEYETLLMRHDLGIAAVVAGDRQAQRPLQPQSSRGREGHQPRHDPLDRGAARSQSV
jgi:hypothetical protein